MDALVTSSSSKALLAFSQSSVCGGSDAPRSSSHGYGRDGGGGPPLEMPLPSWHHLRHSPWMRCSPAEGVPLACEVEV